MLFWLTRKAAEILGPGFDLEIVEMHHRLKKDAPSGTARTLAEILAMVRNQQLEKVARGRNLTTPQAALAWLLSQAVITSPIIGANSVEQLNESLGAAGVRLLAEEMAALNDMSRWE